MTKYLKYLLAIILLCGCAHYHYKLPSYEIKEMSIGNTGIASEKLTVWENWLGERYVLVPLKNKGYVKIFLEDEFPPRVHFIKGIKGLEMEE